MKPRAFTLVELTVVLVIIAIAAAAVTLRTQGPLRQARMRDVVGAIAHAERTTRSAASEQDRAFQLVVDLSDGRVSRSRAQGRPAGTALVQLPQGFRVGAVLMRRRDVSGGSVSIPVSRRGLTPTYAVLIDGGQQRQWLVFAGLTGEMVEVDREEDARRAVRTAGPRFHTD